MHSDIEIWMDFRVFSRKQTIKNAMCVLSDGENIFQMIRRYSRHLCNFMGCANGRGWGEKTFWIDA